MTTWQAFVAIVLAINGLLIAFVLWGLKVLADAIIDLFDQDGR
jgi:hypothetical protein